MSEKRGRKRERSKLPAIETGKGRSRKEMGDIDGKRGALVKGGIISMTIPTMNNFVTTMLKYIS